MAMERQVSSSIGIPIRNQPMTKLLSVSALWFESPDLWLPGGLPLHRNCRASQVLKSQARSSTWI
jgi:hypothetical protein